MERADILMAVLVAGVFGALFAWLAAITTKWVGTNLREGRLKVALLRVWRPENAFLGVVLIYFWIWLVFVYPVS